MQTTNAMQCNPRYKQQYQLSYSLVFLTQEEIETETVPLPFNYVPDDADGIPTTNGAARTDDDDDAEREREGGWQLCGAVAVRQGEAQAERAVLWGGPLGRSLRTPRRAAG